jgi:2-phosphosulfolactate phosphatase
MKARLIVDVCDTSQANSAETSVVVDTFRSSSTITTALDNGARAVIPFNNIVAAMRCRRELKDGSTAILVGERDGITPRGFDYNISPYDMSAQNAGGKMIIYTSSNLTRVLAKLRRSRIIIGGINNARAVAHYLQRYRRIALVPCGTIDGPTIEDIVGAGSIIDSLHAGSLTDNALIALGLYRSPKWRQLCIEGRTAKLMCKLGMERDIELCLRANVSSIVPGVIKGRIVKLRG